MKRLTLAMVVLGLATLGWGCKDRQEEAQRLQDELDGQTETVVDTPATDTAVDLVPETIPDPATTPEAEEMGATTPDLTMPPRDDAPGFTVQVSSTLSAEYAVTTEELYRNRGYEPFTETASVDGETYYRTRIGYFDTFEEAKALQAELVDRYSVTTWIDRIGN